MSTQYQVQPLFWTQLIAMMVDFLIIVAIGIWLFSQAKKAWRGEEIARPF